MKQTLFIREPARWKLDITSEISSRCKTNTKQKPRETLCERHLTTRAIKIKSLMSSSSNRTIKCPHGCCLSHHVITPAQICIVLSCLGHNVHMNDTLMRHNHPGSVLTCPANDRCIPAKRMCCQKSTSGLTPAGTAEGSNIYISCFFKQENYFN